VKKHEIVIDIAAYGWQGEAWQGFYPADLPDDWRLDFYSNEFRSVVVPADMWPSINPDMVEEWLDAVHDEFRFYFEITAEQLPSQEQNAMMVSLESQWGGWVCQTPDGGDQTPSAWYGGEAIPRQMREAIDKLYANLGSSQRGVIVVDSTIEPWEVASDMRQLVELMGYG